jgi:hypothetical protein
MKAEDWTMLHAYERGLDDGLLRGERENMPLGKSDEERAAYQRGYDHGVWLYCETLEGDNNARGLHGQNKKLDN